MFITGAGSGIGYQTALVFAEGGADIIATDMNMAGLEELKPLIERLGRQCHIQRLDVTDEAAYSMLAGELESAGRIPDIVVNNAGLGIMSPFLQTTTADWQLTLNVNVMGVVYGCRLFAALWQQPGNARPPRQCSLHGLYRPTGQPVGLRCQQICRGRHERGVGDGVPGFGHHCQLPAPGGYQHRHRPGQLADAYGARGGGTPAAPLSASTGIIPEWSQQDIANGVLSGTGTILSGKGVARVALMKRLLPRRAFRKLLIAASRKMGYLPLQ